MRHTVRSGTVLYKRVSIALAAGVISALLLQSLVFATETGTWVDGDLPELVLGSQSEDGRPQTCTNTDFKYHSLTKPSGEFDSVGRRLTQPVCAAQHPLGMFGSTAPYSNPDSFEFIQPSSVSLSFRVTNGAGQQRALFPVPGQRLFAWALPATDGDTVRLFDNFAKAGSFISHNSSTRKELTFTLGSGVALPEPLKDSNGSALSVRRFVFSQNGEWMLMEVSGIGMVRMNTVSREMQLISTKRVAYGMGTSPQVMLGISDDGNSAMYSVFSNLGAQQTVVFDLSACQRVPVVPASTSVATATITSGCKSRDVSEQLGAQVSGFIGLLYLRFNGDGKRISGAAYRKNVSGQYEFYDMTYSHAGYEPTRLSYLALGDSFSSGEGIFEYVYGTANNNPRNKCHLSTKSYPYLAARDLGIGTQSHNVACSGATSRDYFSEQKDQEEVVDSPLGFWSPGHRPQQAYVDNSHPEVITISMIGNDIGFGDKIKRCLEIDTCFQLKGDRQSIAEEINRKFGDLVALYESIRRDSGGAKVYVMGYPQLFDVTSPNACKLNVSLDFEERLMARMLTGYLNATIKAAASEAGVVYIDVEHVFAGKQLCGAGTGVMAVNGFTGGTESFHPNALGHQLMSQQLLLQSQNFTRAMPLPDSSNNAPGSNSEVYRNFIDSASPGGIFTPATYQDFAGDVLYLGVSTVIDRIEVPLRPAAPIQAWFHSEPVFAGTLMTSQYGELSGEITVPTSITPGYHTLHLYGQNIVGEQVDLYKTVYVAASETDYDGDGILNEDEKCLAVEPANVDEDRDGVDDACDPEITEAPQDSAAPIVTATPDRHPNEYGWYNDDVMITWSATDPEPSSGAPTVPAPTVANLEGEHEYTSEPSCDPLNNCATGISTLKIDKSAPEITYTLSSDPTIFGWHNQAVTLTFHCSDGLSGVESCTEPQTVSGPDGVRAITGMVTDNAGNSTGVNVFISLDSTNPIISNTLTPEANSYGWHNGDVVVQSGCADELSGVLTCSEPVVLSTEGANQEVTLTVTDKAGNTASATSHVNIDKIAPVLGAPVWTGNPKPVSGTATLQLAATDTPSGLSEAEYFLGDTDPGLGNGATAHVNNDMLTTTFNTDFPTGVYKVSVRAKDKAGNWSAPVSDYLVVYDPSGVRMTGKRTLLPTFTRGDILPGLISNTQTDKAKFGFNIRYDKTGAIHRNSDFQFSYETGTKCSKPTQSVNCHKLELNATSIQWLTSQGANNSTGIFQGNAALEVDGVSSQAVFRLTGVDGEKLDTQSEDHLTLSIFNHGDNPNTASPVYRVDADVLRGNIKVRVD